MRPDWFSLFVFRCFAGPALLLSKLADAVVNHFRD